jgi:nitrate/nitrite transporter NarK
MGPFGAISTERLPTRIVGSVTGFVNALGNFDAYFATFIVGYLNKRTDRFFSGFRFMGVITLFAAGFSLLLKTTLACSQNQALKGDRAA